MSTKTPIQTDCFTPFRASIGGISLPERFTFPFYYEPHPLCLLAAEQVQGYLKGQTDWEHNFGIEEGKAGMVIGKMFGVLVVENEAGQIGYLAAFSGKLAGGHHHPGFVPPVFDMLREGSFFLEGEEVINGMNRKIEALEQDPAYLECQQLLASVTALGEESLAHQKKQAKAAKAVRKARREQAEKELPPSLYALLLEELRQESIKDSYFLKKLTKYWKYQVIEHQQKLAIFTEEIDRQKAERAASSAALQKRLFDQYQFLNQRGEQKSLGDIFQENVPTSGAGDCAAPKLLQYAFQHGFKPIAMAEFWWGASPKSEIRKHGNFYSACRGKCEPILLGHMLQGIEMDENPMLKDPPKELEIAILHEDDHLLVINKPPEILSVPGKHVEDSVYLRMRHLYPEATGPLMAHRLDMSTSGVMLVAKTSEAHKFLQRQFIRRTIKKRYVAVIEGMVEGDEGIIDLPLRHDIDDRPRQLVCYEHGKPARTEWKVIDRHNQRTRIHFFPLTGRSHQLRVHAAHEQGLNLPIVGDDIYGTRADRLHLHAESITFRHPESREMMTVEAKADF